MELSYFIKFGFVYILLNMLIEIVSYGFDGIILAYIMIVLTTYGFIDIVDKFFIRMRKYNEQGKIKL